MGRRATAGTCLASLVKMAVPLCKQAELQCPRTGPGRKPEIPDWVLTVLIMVAVLKRRKAKSAQYRFLEAHRRKLVEWLGTNKFPARSTYFDRYRRAHRLFQVAIRLQGGKAIAEGVTDPKDVAVDKSLVAARGPLWHKSDRKRNRVPKKLRGVDRDSDWGYSKHDGWVQGYSFEVVVSSTKDTTVFPLSGSAATASAKETQTFDEKIDELPEQTKTVSADSVGPNSGELGPKRKARKETMTGADVLVRQLKAQGVPFVSTLCGNGLDPFYVACRRHGLPLVDVRNEQAAGYMADAVGRLTRRVGVCSASSGVAHVNALTGLTNAHFDGAPVVTPIWDQGSVSRPMPEFLGVVGAASGGPALLADSDAIVLAGARVDYRVGYMKPPAIAAKAWVVRVDREPGELNQGVSPDVGLLGDPAVVLAQLCEEWQRRHLAARTDWLREAQRRNVQYRARWAKSPAAPPMTGQHLVEALRPVLTDEVIFLIDGGNIGQWAHVLLWDRYPGHWLTCGASAVVGWGLPGAIAAKLLHPDRPVLLLSGDGAIGFTIAELEIAVRHQVPIVVVVADDQAWGIVASGQKRSLGKPIASLLGPTDYAKVAQGFGARGVLVENPQDLTAATRQALAPARPTLIEVPLALLGPTDIT